MSENSGRHVRDAGLQPERTTLAWRRLAIALLGLALATPKFAWPFIGAWSIIPAVAEGFGAVFLLVRAHTRYMNSIEGQATVRLGPALDGRFPLLAAIISFVLAAVGIAIVIGSIRVSLPFPG